MSISRRQFLQYIQAFNARDYATQHSFYHHDVRLVIPDPEIGTLYGSGDIMSHYSIVHDMAEETVVPMIVLIGDDIVFFIMETYFRYTKPTDQAVHGHKVQAGDVIRVKVWATYDMRDGKMLQITCNGLSDELLGQIDVDKAIEDSWNRADEKVKAEWKPKSFM